MRSISPRTRVPSAELHRRVVGVLEAEAQLEVLGLERARRGRPRGAGSAAGRTPAAAPRRGRGSGSGERRNSPALGLQRLEQDPLGSGQVGGGDPALAGLLAQAPEGQLEHPVGVASRAPSPRGRARASRASSTSSTSQLDRTAGEPLQRAGRHRVAWRPAAPARRAAPAGRRPASRRRGPVRATRALPLGLGGRPVQRPGHVGQRARRRARSGRANTARTSSTKNDGASAGCPPRRSTRELSTSRRSARDAQT